ncbi:NADH dehydrogenase subunit [uncultured Rikenella sp.]|uniref:hydrogenase large subunit n=1 Tax=uncultured Rikenella sp. TaxID=368003 RepID=UPI00262388D9|nr:NADH dehydrogenase subunit [uncultured Rikenella sp.]
MNTLDRWAVCRPATSGGVGIFSEGKIPELPYAAFAEDMRRLLLDETGSAAEGSRCVAYFAVPQGEADAGEGISGLTFYALVARDETGDMLAAKYVRDYHDEGELASLAAEIPALHVYERDIAERYGVRFVGTPWDKPLRYPFDRFRQRDRIDTYPFYSIDGHELHEVHVGPVHAGIIEPGAFRFLCDGERIVHLEIALGYQHRGVEAGITGTSHRLRQMLLGETIAGDTVIGHGTALAGILESGAGGEWEGNGLIRCERAVALEMERLAIHIGDTAALCMDLGYQTGHVACEALRTLVINAMQQWCGNRFGKGLVRPFGANHRLTLERAKYIEATLAQVMERYRMVGRDLLSTPSVLSRLEGICTVTKRQALQVGAVGPAARMAGVARDARRTFAFYPLEGFEPVVIDAEADGMNGDLMARLKMRLREAEVSYTMIGAGCKELAGRWFEAYPAPDYGQPLASEALVVSVTEGWRGEICHVALTDRKGELRGYRIFDPSLHNWMMLALSVRGAQISDFPVSNKSFNLSYCGHDL